MNLVAIIYSMFILVLLSTHNKFKHKTDIDKWGNGKEIATYGGLILFPIASLINNPMIIIFSVLMFLLGLLDDVKKTDVIHKFYCQIGACIIFVYYVSPLNFEISFIYFLFLLAMINAFNFIDNMDGHLTSIAIAISFGLLQFKGDIFFHTLIWVLLVFLFFNFFLKWIYIGNCGSYFLGFLLTATAISYNMEVWQLIGFFLIPIIDINFVTINRIRQKQKPWIGDKFHISHNLARHTGETASVYLLFFVQFLSCTITNQLSRGL